MSAVLSFDSRHMRSKHLLRLKVNGETLEVAAYSTRTLLEVLKEDLGLMGTNTAARSASAAHVGGNSESDD